MNAVLEHRRRLMEMGGLLPSGYTKLAYLENTTGAFFSLPTITNNSRVEIYFAPYLSLTSGSYSCIFGRDSSMQLAYTSAGKASRGNATSSSIYYQEGVVAKVEGCISAILANAFYKIDDTNINLARASSTGITYFVFAAYSNGNYNAKGKMFSFKMWDASDVLIKDLIPCIDPNNVYGMYDIITDTFYSSDNQNAFTGA